MRPKQLLPMFDFESPYVEGLLARSGVTLIEWRWDGDWPVEAASCSIEEFRGLTPTDVARRDQSLAHLIHPADLQEFTRELNELEDGQVYISHSPLRLRTVRSEWVWVCAATAVDDGGTIGAPRCLTTLSYSPENQRVFEELDAQRQLQQLVIEGTRIGLWEWTPSSGEFGFNSQVAEMLGFSSEELKPSAATWEVLLHPEDLGTWNTERCHHQGGDPSTFEAVYRLRHKQGHWVHVLSRSRGLDRGLQGRPVRVNGTCTDITRLRQAELEAHRAAEAKSQFFARMSHEIRTPLNGILGVLEMVEEAPDARERERLMDIMRGSGELLLETLNGVLDLAKLEAGAMPVERRAFNPREVLARVIELFASVGSRNSLEVCFHTDEAVPEWVCGDGHKLRQVVCNLVSNAVKFTERGAVEVKLGSRSLSDQELELVVEVSDTGCGIADLDSIWDCYHQADESVSRTHGGSGLGLAICRELTTLLGGGIEAHSELGQGTTIRVTMPVRLEAEPAHRKQETCGERGQDARGSLRVLVAEDNPVNRLVIQATLERLGVSPTLVEDGALAVEACEQQSFDLVLLDIQMPVLDGVRAAARISELYSGRRAPKMVALSADTSESNQTRCRAVGLTRFLPKPFRTDAIKELLDELVAPGCNEAA